MTDQADPVALDVEAQLGVQRREHVLPDGIARARVVEADRLIEVLGLELIEVLTRLLVDRRLRPPRRKHGAARELLEGQRATDAEVVVAGETDGSMSARELNAGVRIRAVADEVAEAPHLVA